MVYFSGHADGETRRHRTSEDRNGESRADESQDRVPELKGDWKLRGGQRTGRGSFGIVERKDDHRGSSDSQEDLTILHR